MGQTAFYTGQKDTAPQTLSISSYYIRYHCSKTFIPRYIFAQAYESNICLGPNGVSFKNKAFQKTKRR